MTLDPLCRTAYTMANGLKVNAVLYLVPSRPGHSLAFVKFMSRLPDSLGGSGQKLTQRLRSLPKVLRMLPKRILKLFIPAAALEHSLNHGIQDQVKTGLMTLQTSRIQVGSVSVGRQLVRQRCRQPRLVSRSGQLCNVLDQQWRIWCQ